MDSYNGFIQGLHGQLISAIYFKGNHETYILFNNLFSRFWGRKMGIYSKDFSCFLKNKASHWTLARLFGNSLQKQILMCYSRLVWFKLAKILNLKIPLLMELLLLSINNALSLDLFKKEGGSSFLGASLIQRVGTEWLKTQGCHLFP